MTPAEIDVLNRGFGIPDLVAVVPGNGGLPKVRVTAPWASADLYLHGAQLTSWQPSAVEEVLFLSGHSSWQDGRAIRGGIPVCFPWFRSNVNDPSAPAHGVVRTKEWQLESVKLEEGSVIILCSTEDDASTQRWWPHAFRIAHKVTIGESLRLELKVTNTGQRPFQFEEALHSYFRVSRAESVSVRGPNQIAYLDNVDGNHQKYQAGDLILTGKTDNAYIDVYSPVELIDPAFGRRIRTEKLNSATTVVWNPWQDGAASIHDLGNDEWQEFVCVEASNILSSAISLAPGREHTMKAIISIARPS